MSLESEGERERDEEREAERCAIRGEEKEGDPNACDDDDEDDRGVVCSLYANETKDEKQTLSLALLSLSLPFQTRLSGLYVYRERRQGKKVGRKHGEKLKRNTSVSGEALLLYCSPQRISCVSHSTHTHALVLLTLIAE